VICVRKCTFGNKESDMHVCKCLKKMILLSLKLAFRGKH